MPSPIAHAAVGAALAGSFRRGPLAGHLFAARIPVALVLSVGFSLLPDVDAAVGILLGNLGKFHNNLAGSPVFATLVAAVSAGIAWLVRKELGRPVFQLSFVCYQLHVLMDFFTVGRGVMLAWPLSTERFAPPFPLFFGLRWSHGLFSESHWITLGSELAFAVLLFLGLRVWRGQSGSQRLT